MSEPDDERVYRETDPEPIGCDPDICVRCRGSGGGPDAALKCPVCRGSGRSATSIEREAEERAEYLADQAQDAADEDDRWI